MYFIKGYPGYTYNPITGDVTSSRMPEKRVLKWSASAKVGLRRDGATFYFTRTELSPLLYKITDISLSQPTTVPTDKFIIGTRDGEGFSVSTRPHIHLSLHEARQEAERLAKTNPNKKFVVMKIEGQVVASGVTWS